MTAAASAGVLPAGLSVVTGKAASLSSGDVGPGLLRSVVSIYRIQISIDPGRSSRDAEVVGQRLKDLGVR